MYRTLRYTPHSLRSCVALLRLRQKIDIYLRSLCVGSTCMSSNNEQSLTINCYSCWMVPAGKQCCSSGPLGFGSKDVACVSLLNSLYIFNAIHCKFYQAEPLFRHFRHRQKDICHRAKLPLLHDEPEMAAG